MSFDVAPLPSGYRRVSQHAWLVDDAGVRTVYVRSVTVAQYDLSDKTGRNVAMVLLDAGGYAKQTEIAVAFGLTSRQVNRLCTRVAREGWAALARKERADKTPPSVAARVCALRQEGLKVAAIAEQVGLSPRTVYGVLVDRGLDPHDRHGAVQTCLAVDEGSVDAAQVPVETEAAAEDDTPTLAEQHVPGLGWDKPEADVEFENAHGVRGAGALLAVAVEGGVLLQEARRQYGQLRAGVYGLRALVQGLFLMACLGVRSAEGLKAEPPEGLGTLLGLSRIFEVKTLRRKLREVGAKGMAGPWYQAMTKRWVAEADDEIATLYVDGHTRAYYGKRPIAKGWCARRRLCQPATTDTWTHDSLGRPLLRITHEAHPTLAQALPDLMADVRKLVGPERITVAFDRGGWSAATFKALGAAGFDFVTYRPGHHEPLPAHEFVECKLPEAMGGRVQLLADRQLQLRGYGEARLIVIVSNSGKQAHIVTSNREAQALDVVLQLKGRWRQENNFKYLRQNYNIDALVDYSTEPVKDREIPNPQYKELTKQLRRARAQLRNLQAQAEAARAGAQAPNSEADVQQRIAAQSQHIQDLLEQRNQLPHRCMLSESNRADEVKLAIERKLCSDLIKVAAYRAERQLVRRIEGAFARNADEGHAFIRTAMQQTGQIRVEGRNVYVTLEPMSAPRFTRALQALCAAINSDCPTYPETDWRLHFEVRDDEDRHLGTTACQEF